MANLLRFGERKNKFGVMQMMCCTDGEYVKFVDIKELLQTTPNRQRDEIKPDCGNCLLAGQCTYFGFPSESCGYSARV